ncbi:MAG: DUF4115 domain-containing protein [Anaerolineae bacterium]|nr:DUF4115 domain-containing protein [Anaerolineae bacterium]
MVDSLGAWLRHARESQHIDLEDVVRSLRIRRQYLQALEIGDYEALPGSIQARGFLRNYVRFLGLPIEDALARYDAEISGQPLPPRMPQVEISARGGERTWAPPPPSLEQERVAVRANSSGGLVRILGVVLLFFALVSVASFLWLQFGPDDAAGNTAIPTTAVPRDAAGSLQMTPTFTPQPTPSFPVLGDGTVRIRLVPAGHAWISISADAAVVFQGIAEPQQLVEAVAEEILIVSTGDGGAFRLYVNGTDWGMLGDQAEVVRRAWTPLGETSLEDS